MVPPGLHPHTLDYAAYAGLRRVPAALHQHRRNIPHRAMHCRLEDEALDGAVRLGVQLEHLRLRRSRRDYAAEVPQISRRDRAEITPSRGRLLQQNRLMQRVQIRPSSRADPDDGHVAAQVLGEHLPGVCQADGSRVG